MDFAVDVLLATVIGGAISLAATLASLRHHSQSAEVQLKREVFVSAADYFAERLKTLSNMLTYEDGKFMSSEPSSPGTSLQMSIVASKPALRSRPLS